MARGTTLQSLQDRLEQILRDLDKAQREVDKIKAQEALITDLIREAKGEPKQKLRAPRSNIKQTVLEILQRVGDAGLNSSICVEMAAKDGYAMERGSVSSLLSRLKNEGVLTYDGSLYRLATGKSETSTNILSIRTSGIFS